MEPSNTSEVCNTLANSSFSTKRCCTCKLTKPKEDFYKNKLYYDGINPQCKSCNMVCYNKYKEKRAYKKITCECGRVINKDSLRYHLGSHIHIALMVKLRGSYILSA